MRKLLTYCCDTISDIDCTKTFGDEIYFESSATYIRKTTIGNYRECDNVKFSRLAYRFNVKNVQRPHVISVEYPDDKERTFCIMDGRTYDFSTGIATGREMPVSGKMITHNIIFWPRWKECTIMFITWDQRSPAAVSRIKVFELEEKYFEDDNSVANTGFRQIGFQWEDPCGRYLTMGAVRKPDWSKRVASYAAAASQTLIQYPITWYWGCLYPSKVDETDHLEMLVDGKSTTYVNPIHSVYDWVKEAIEEFGKKNINFMGVFHAYRFYNLLRAAKKDTSIRNINFDGSTQISTLDWTRTWNRYNIPLMAASEQYRCDDEVLRGTAYDCTSGMKEIPSDILGEPMGKLDGFCSPIFNCLHPAVEKHLIELMTELKDRYCGYKNFKGITIPLWGATFIWYGSLKTGYDDQTFSLFEKETGLKSNINTDNPQRFKMRFEWVMANFKKEWINWRCGKIRSLLGRMQKALAGDRKDVRLVVSACREPLLGQLYTGQSYHESYHSETLQLCNIGSFASILKEGGIDLSLFGDVDGIEIEIQNDPYRDRSLEIRTGKTPRSNGLRDHDLLDYTTNKLIGSGSNRNVFIFNCYYESGRYVIGQARDSAMQELKEYGSGLNDSIHTMYLTFDHKTWPWFEHEFTTCPGVPASDRNFLEYYANAVAEMDAKTITFGGLLIGTYGHEEHLKQFSRQFNFLPEKAFDTVASNSDAIVVRYIDFQCGKYMYLINTEPSILEVAVEFDQAGITLSSPDQQDTVALGVQQFLLQPYELKAYRMNTGNPLHADVKIDEDLAIRVQQAKLLLSQALSLKEDTKLRSWLINELNDCIDLKKHRRLRHVFRSYPAQKLIRNL